MVQRDVGHSLPSILNSPQYFYHRIPSRKNIREQNQNFHSEETTQGAMDSSNWRLAIEILFFCVVIDCSQQKRDVVIAPVPTVTDCRTMILHVTYVVID